MWTLVKCSLPNVIFDNTRKNRTKSFFHQKYTSFQKFVFSTTSQLLHRWIYNFNSYCRSTLWSQKHVTWGQPFSVIMAKLAFVWEKPFLWSFVSTDILGLKETILKIPQYLSVYVVNPQKFFLWRLSYSILSEIIGQTIFFTAVIAFFLKKSILPFDILGLKGMILLLGQ